MATWHQLAADHARLYYQDQWAVVCDPPQTTRTVSGFKHEQDARIYAENMNALHYRPRYGHDYAYVLPPTSKRTQGEHES